MFMATLGVRHVDVNKFTYWATLKLLMTLPRPLAFSKVTLFIENFFRFVLIYFINLKLQKCQLTFITLGTQRTHSLESFLILKSKVSYE